MAEWRKCSDTGVIIFFDWDHDGASDHVGIVESCDGTTVHTIEGNSGNTVKQNSYTVNSQSIWDMDWFLLKNEKKSKNGLHCRSRGTML